MKTNDGIERLRADARSLFISTATIDDTLSWATPRQIDAIGRMLRCELDNRDTAKRERLLRRARFPVMKTLDGYDYTHVRLPDGYTRLEFLDHAQDLVFYGRTGRGKTHLATALGVKAIGQGRAVRFCQTAELVLQLGKAKRAGSLDQILKDLARADLIILDEFGYVPSTSTAPACSTRSSPAPMNDAASSSPPTSNSANGAPSSRMTNSPPRSSTASSTTDASSNSTDQADA